MTKSHPMFGALRAVGVSSARVTSLLIAYQAARCPGEMAEWLASQGVAHHLISDAQAHLDPHFSDVSQTFQRARLAIANSRTAAQSIAALLAPAH